MPSKLCVFILGVYSVFFLSLAVQGDVQACLIPTVDHRIYSLIERGWSCHEEKWVREAEQVLKRKLTEKERKKIVASCGRCSDQNRALEKAVCRGNLAVLQRLLSAGISPNRLVRSKGHRRSRQALKVRDRFDDPIGIRRVFPLINQDSYVAYVSLLELAIVHNHKDIAIALLKAGAHCNTLVCLGETALVHALAYNPECVPVLLQRGARMPTRCELFDLTEQERILLFSHAPIAQQRQDTISGYLRAWEVPDVLVDLIGNFEGSVVERCPIPSYTVKEEVVLSDNRIGLRQQTVLCNKRLGTIYELASSWLQHHAPPPDESSYVFVGSGKKSLAADECQAIEKLLATLVRQ